MFSIVDDTPSEGRETPEACVMTTILLMEYCRNMFANDTTIDMLAVKLARFLHRWQIDSGQVYLSQIASHLHIQGQTCICPQCLKLTILIVARNWWLQSHLPCLNPKLSTWRCCLDSMYWIKLLKIQPQLLLWMTLAEVLPYQVGVWAGPLKTSQGEG